MKYDVEADFFPLTTCNFRCSYCFLSRASLGAKIKRFGTNEQWERGFNATGKTWLIHITGGEPFIYPDFVDLCQRLIQRHYLSINSNLAHRAVDEFTEKIDPARVHFINAAVHLAERRTRTELESFIARARKLQATGFSTLVSMVMIPKLVEQFPRAARGFAAQGLCLVPKILRGTFQGKTYPDSYSPREKALLEEYFAASRQAHGEVLERMGEPPTIDMFSDGRFLNGVPSYRGKLCGSGHNFVQIQPDGSVVRCGSGQRLGNILEGDVALLRSPTICDTGYCPYFCEKYTSPRFARQAVPSGVTSATCARSESQPGPS